jgi:hypothetical protein
MQPAYEVYQLQTGTVGTRHSWRLDWSSSATGTHSGTHFVSITMISRTCAEMHSSAPFQEIPAQPTLFMEVLKSYEDCGLWEHLSVNGDGEWIHEGMATGSLIIAHDGSYMALEAPDLCSAGLVLFCKTSKKWLKASAAERLEVASNYCGKLLGALISLLILRAASVTLDLPIQTGVLHCNNHGVINHRNLPRVSLHEKQRQADLIRHIEHLVSTT